MEISKKFNDFVYFLSLFYLFIYLFFNFSKCHTLKFESKCFYYYWLYL